MDDSTQFSEIRTLKAGDCAGGYANQNDDTEILQDQEKIDCADEIDLPETIKNTDRQPLNNEVDSLNETGPDEEDSIFDGSGTSADRIGKYPLPPVGIHRIRLDSIQEENIKYDKKRSKKIIKKNLIQLEISNLKLSENITDIIFNSEVKGGAIYKFAGLISIEKCAILALLGNSSNDPDLLIIRENIESINFEACPLFKSVPKSNPDKFLQCLRSHNESITVHIANASVSCILFITIGDSLYAIASNHGGSTLRCYGDFKFHNEIPLKILSPDGALCYAVRSVMMRGSRQTNVNDKEPVKLQDLKYGDICQKYSAYLETELQKKFSLFLHRSKILVDVGLSRLKFRTEIPLWEMICMLFKLEYIFTKSEFDKPDSGLNTVIVLVDKELSTELDEKLNTLLQEMVDKKELHGWVDMFDVTHGAVKEFTKAVEVYIHFRKIFVKLNANPTFRSVCEAILELNVSESAQNRILEAVKISYSIEEKLMSKRESLEHFLQGTFYHKGTHYWRVGKNWYEVTQEFLITVQKKFQNILKEHLLPHFPLNGINLHNSWPHIWKRVKDCPKLCPEIKEDAYTNLYTLQNYFIGDKVCPKGIEYFDLLFDSKNVSYLYHIKHGFGNTTRDACNQLENAAENLHKFKTEIDPMVKGGLELYLQRRGKDKQTSPVFTSEDEMMKVLGLGGEAPNRLVFVLGLLTNERLEDCLVCSGVYAPKIFEKLSERKLVRSLCLEKDLPLEFQRDFISSHLNSEKTIELAQYINCEKSDVVGKIEEFLLHNQFIQVIDQGYAVKARLLLCESQGAFVGLFLNNQVKTHKEKGCKMIMKMLQKFTTYFGSFGAKLSIVRTVDNGCLDKDSFKVYEILSKVVNKREDVKTEPKGVDREDYEEPPVKRKRNEIKLEQ